MHTQGDSPAFAALQIHGWRQFKQVDLEFHPRATILTGANASGKTTLLALLARHFNWPRRWVGIPIRRSDGTFWYFLDPERESDWESIGTLTYGSGSVATIQLPAKEGQDQPLYDLNFSPQQSVNGLYITSHRLVSSYTKLENIPVSFGSPTQLFNDFHNEVRNRYMGNRSIKTPFVKLKESLIAAGVFAESTNSLEADPLARDIWYGYQEVLNDLFPDSLGFKRLVVRNPEIVVEAESGDFTLDESSGGLSALMELGYQILLRSREQKQFTILFDEPENHLHPSLQREIVPSLIKAFPEVQFIISTHSPFVVTSVPDSNVYVLEYGSDQRVNSRLLDQANKAANADETLRRVLGLDSTMPLWAEHRFGSIIERYFREGLTAASVRRLRAELVDAGLGSEFPDALIRAADRDFDAGE